MTPERLQQAAEQARTRSAAMHPLSVKVRLERSLRSGNDTVYGGGPLNSSSASCTAGFAVRNSSSQGLTTAGHAPYE